MRAPTLVSEIAGGVDPAALFQAIAHAHDDVFWLDSGPEAVSGRSILGWSPRRHVAHDADAVDFGLLRRELLAARRASTRPSGSGDSDGVGDEDRAGVSTVLSTPGVPLGWVGWLGYELRAATMGEPPRHQLRHPPLAMLWVDRAVVIDHDTGSAWLVALGPSWNEALTRWRDEVLTLIRNAGAQPGRAASAPPAPAPGSATVRWRHSDERYLEMIDECRDAIRAGDAYLLCLTNEATIDGRFDPVERYLALRRTSPAHHGGFLRIAGTSLLSASPEQFLLAKPDGTVETRPIKGTRRRGTTVIEDERLHRELRESEKERAENLMIVDLMRNDLQRVCRVGSVEVPRLLEIESYAQVHQLVSRVRGRLADDNDALDAVQACLPGGSMTGAPKRSATRILDRLEEGPRGIYSGAFGYLGVDGSADLAMVIRSIVIDEEGASIGAGGGITALSDAEAELDEVKLKAGPLLACLGAGRH